MRTQVVYRRQWLLCEDKKVLLNLDRVEFIKLGDDNSVMAFDTNSSAIAMLYPAETGELGFDHLRKILIGE